MSPSPDADAWAITRRCITITLLSGASGMAPGAISGTVLPLFGTIVGAGGGRGGGLGVSVAVVPLLLKRNLGRSFGVMLAWSMVVAGVSVLTAWLCLFLGYDLYLAQVYTYVAVPVTVLVYLAGAVRAYQNHPVAWPKPPSNGCARCGYPLVGLASWICPECGTDNEPKRLAQPE